MSSSDPQKWKVTYNKDNSFVTLLMNLAEIFYCFSREHLTDSLKPMDLLN